MRTTFLSSTSYGGDSKEWIQLVHNVINYRLTVMLHCPSRSNISIFCGPFVAQINGQFADSGITGGSMIFLEQAVIFKEQAESLAPPPGARHRKGGMYGETASTR